MRKSAQEQKDAINADIAQFRDEKKKIQAPPPQGPPGLVCLVLRASWLLKHATTSSELQC